LRISADGGPWSSVTRLDPNRHESNHTFPVFLPDGNRFLFVVNSQGDYSPIDSTSVAVFAGALDSAQAHRVEGGNRAPAYVDLDSAWLLSLRGERLVAQPFDAGRYELKGSPQVLVENARQFSISETGILTYQSTSRRQVTRLSWMDRHGRRMGASPE